MNEKLSDAMNEIRDEYIVDAGKSRPRKKVYWFSAVAAALAVVLIWHAIANPIVTAKAISRADYSTWTACKADQVRADRDQLAEFFISTMAQVLSGNSGENEAFSPMNLYMALAITAELSGGDSQILALLGADSLETLRSQANNLWRATYRDGNNPCLLANSLWLDNDLSYAQETMDTLAETYYTSVYRGNFGSAMTDHAISAWLNGQTGNLLKDSADGIDLSDETVFALYATIYFQAKWQDEFSAANNTKDVFHSPSGDITCTYMNKNKIQGLYYWGETFGAITLPLKDGNQMWLILPDEGRSPEELLSDPDFASTLFRQAYDVDAEKNSKAMFINLSLPKFDIRSSGDLKADLMELGVTDAFDPSTANFSAIYSGDDPVWLTAVNQATRVAIDEKGVTAASYIEIPGAGAAAPPDEMIDFILDRPFLFVVTNHLGLPLFAGVVNEP